jgi:hypothetical protein
MLNPPDFPYDLKKRVVQNLQSAQVGDQIFDVVQKLLDQIIQSEHIVLARAEKDRLFRQVMKSILTDLLAKLDDDKQN